MQNAMGQLNVCHRTICLQLFQLMKLLTTKWVNIVCEMLLNGLRLPSISFIFRLPGTTKEVTRFDLKSATNYYRRDCTTLWRLPTNDCSQQHISWKGTISSMSTQQFFRGVHLTMEQCYHIRFFCVLVNPQRISSENIILIIIEQQ